MPRKDLFFKTKHFERNVNEYNIVVSFNFASNMDYALINYQLRGCCTIGFSAFKLHSNILVPYCGLL